MSVIKRQSFRYPVRFAASRGKAPPPFNVSSVPTRGRMPAFRAAWKKRGAPATPSRSTSASVR
jgi:hypothetical protein